MPQEDVSGYLKPKNKTLTELDQASAAATDKQKSIKNPVDKLAYEVNRATENARGVTDYIRNIFDD